MLVRAYDSSLRQTLSAVQLELRAAQQMAIKNVNNLNQQLTTFNDSTIIGDSFVRYAHATKITHQRRETVQTIRVRLNKSAP